MIAILLLTAIVVITACTSSIEVSETLVHDRESDETLTFAEAQEELGFKFTLPTYLPESLDVTPFVEIFRRGERPFIELIYDSQASVIVLRITQRPLGIPVERISATPVIFSGREVELLLNRQDLSAREMQYFWRGTESAFLLEILSSQPTRDNSLEIEAERIIVSLMEQDP